eukprot:TRINITY_DN658_c0_g1_i1.p1 TRINITY_DN658_c0_g1~~TRINITY_DN658_c0_g1_i1.p1  ORF type:complete len:730 (+),score=139.98 TRINITY_DN658_c0_g1_i1:143-2332(+)
MALFTRSAIDHSNGELSYLLPPGVVKNLADKDYNKRKNAALEVENLVRSLASQGEHDRINAVINQLINDFACSTQSNNRKGGLLALAATTVGLAGESGLSGEAAQHLERIVPPVLHSLTDQDSRVRYYACEALYNIAKAARQDFIVHFNDVFDALCKLSADSDLYVQNAAHLLDRLVKDIVTASDQFSIQEFIPQLKERMNILNPLVRQFLVGWITVLDSVPDIDMLGFLPEFLDGLFNMLNDTSVSVRQQAFQALGEFLTEITNAPAVEYGKMTEILVNRASSPDEFTSSTAMTWIQEFVKLGGNQLTKYYADILGVVLPAMSDKTENIRRAAVETNEALRTLMTNSSDDANSSDDVEIGPLVTAAKEALGSEFETTRYEALRWIQILLNEHRQEVLTFMDEITPSLLQALSDTSDDVVLLVLEVQASIARDEEDKKNFRYLMISLIDSFNEDRQLLKTRGHTVLRRLCQLLDGERIYRELSQILMGEKNLEFATTMVQTLNTIMLTAPELQRMRQLLRQSLVEDRARELFVALYYSWCHSPIPTISLCLIAQAYPHALLLVSQMGESDITVNLLMQVDRLVQLLDTAIFASLRLQLLEPLRYPALYKTLYGLMMLLPQQSPSFKSLYTRLKSINIAAFMQMDGVPGTCCSRHSNNSRGEIVARSGENREDLAPEAPIDFSDLLYHYNNQQQLHRQERLNKEAALHAIQRANQNNQRHNGMVERRPLF